MIGQRLALVAFTIFAALAPQCAPAQPVASTYATQDGRAETVVIACPNTDGSFTAGRCATATPTSVIYASAAATAVAVPNTPVTVFTPGSVLTGCDVLNTGTAILYLDFTTIAAAGSGTSIPLQPGQSFHCPYPPSGAVTAIAAQSQPFVAVRY